MVKGRHEVVCLLHPEVAEVVAEVEDEGEAEVEVAVVTVVPAVLALVVGVVGFEVEDEEVRARDEVEAGGRSATTVALWLMEGNRNDPTQSTSFRKR
jgi:hypothetical protein